MAVVHFIWYVIVGLIVGLCARALMPGAQHLGFVATVLLGIVGSFVGGFLGSLVSRPRQGSYFHPAGFLLSIVGALIVLYLYIHYILPR